VEINHTLSIVVAKYLTENCLGGLVRHDKQFIAKLDENMKKSGVKVVEGYLDKLGNSQSQATIAVSVS
jgi:hypothetical protein